MAGWYDNVGSLPASSRHQGGAHVLMGDGAVIFMTDSVEAGDQDAPVISYYNKHGQSLWTVGSSGFTWCQREDRRTAEPVSSTCSRTLKTSSAKRTRFFYGNRVMRSGELIFSTHFSCYTSACFHSRVQHLLALIASCPVSVWKTRWIRHLQLYS